MAISTISEGFGCNFNSFGHNVLIFEIIIFSVYCIFVIFFFLLIAILLSHLRLRNFNRVTRTIVTQYHWNHLLFVLDQLLLGRKSIVCYGLFVFEFVRRRTIGDVCERNEFGIFGRELFARQHPLLSVLFRNHIS